MTTTPDSGRVIMAANRFNGPPNGRPPHWAQARTIDAERSVIGAVFLRPEVLGAAEIEPADFFDPRRRELWASMRALARDGKPIDPVMVEGDLGRRFTPEAAAGVLGEMSECVGTVPVADNVAHYAAMVREAAITRRVQVALSEVAASGLEGPELLRAAVERVELLSRGVEIRPGSALTATNHVAEAYLMTYPPARDWVLRHPTRNGKPAPPNEGDGLLPRGRVGVLSSAGGVGKTHALIALGVCTVTGRPWLGHFEVDWLARRGKVYLALAEEDPDEIHRRVYAVGQHLRLTAGEIRDVTRRLYINPLAGKAVELVTVADGVLTHSKALEDLHKALEAEADEEGWALVVLDPLARFAGAEVEKDNSVATRFVQALETLTTVNGRPAVLTAHHSSKGARTLGQVDARGVTAITDGARWAATLRSEGDDVFFQQVKSNYSINMPEELRLIRDESGVLRAATDDEVEARVGAAEARKAEKDEARIAEAAGKLRVALKAAAVHFTSREEVCGLVSGEWRIRAAALSRLLAEGKVVRVKGAGGRAHFEVSE